MNNATPQQAIVAILRGAGNQISGITFSSTASPFYGDAVPEPAPDFSYLRFTIPPTSSIQHTMGGGYAETFKVLFEGIAESDSIQDACDPRVEHSVYWFLDSFNAEPEAFSGIGYDCIQFIRQSYVLHGPSDQREDAYKRLWIAAAEYEMILSVVYPKRR